MSLPLFRIEILEARIAPAFAPVLDLSSLNGATGFSLYGSGASDGLGNSVSGAGDVNGDGFDDVIVSATATVAGGSRVPSSFVVFGKAGGFPAVPDLAGLNGANGFRLSGTLANDQVSRNVSSAGDVNGDGFDDLVIGSPTADVNGSNSGAAFVVFGKASGFPAVFDLTTLNGSNGFRFQGTIAAYVGGTVSGAGDVNGDGFDDIMIGSSQRDAAYVVFGKRSGWTAALTSTALNGSNGFRLSGPPAGQSMAFFGSSLSNAGDVNGDGFDDLIIGASRADLVTTDNDDTGAAFVVFGKASGWGSVVDVATLNGATGFRVQGATSREYAGRAVSSAGDVNGDGFDDLMVSSTQGTYVIFGKQSGFAASLSVSALNGANGFKLLNEESYSRNSAVSSAGDFNGDGFDDLLVGIAHFPYTVGSSYVVFGKAAGYNPTQNLAALNGATGFKVQGDGYQDFLGASVNEAGDVNGDGFADFIIGAPGADANGMYSGSAYVFFGSAEPTISISDAAVEEGNAGAAGLAFTVQLSHSSIYPVTVGFATADGTALAGSDFATLSSATLSFAPGETSKTILVPILGDLVHENTESFSVVLSSPKNATLGDGIGIGTIQNDDAEPVIRLATAAFYKPNPLLTDAISESDERTQSFGFVASLSSASAFPVTVRYFTVAGSAEAGSDFIAPAAGAEITFAPGETRRMIEVGVRGDRSIETDETFSLVLAEPVHAMIAEGSATGRILNDDTAIRVADATVIEGAAGYSRLEFVVSLDYVSAESALISVGVIAGTATEGTDFVPVYYAEPLIFAPGETSKTITVQVLGDKAIEADETLSLVFSSDQRVVRGTATGTIRNDDTAVQISDASAVEGDGGTGAVSFSVSLTQPSALPVTVHFASSAGTAQPGSDFLTPAPGTLTFAPGETSKTLTLEIAGDSDTEADETFSLVLSDAVNATLADAIGIGTIRNDDAALRIGDAAILEGASGSRDLLFTVSLTQASALPVTVHFATADGTAADASDYTAPAPGVLSFAPGETSKTIAIGILGDGQLEPTETFSVLLSDATGATIDDGTGVGTILSDDATLLKGRTATFTDVDGDRVTVTVSRGTLTAANLTLVPAGVGAQLALVDLLGDPAFAGANLTVAVRRGPVGDGLANIGHIDASGVDLGTVQVKGDLGRIDAGDADTSTPGLRSLAANTMGRAGLAAQLPVGSSRSEITGELTSLRLLGGFRDASLSIDGEIGSVTIGGGVREGTIEASGDIARLAIKGSLLGGAIRSDGAIRSLTISGDVLGSEL